MDKKIREIYYSDEYKEYLDALPMRVRVKYDYVEQIIATIKVVSTNLEEKQEVEIANKILRKYMEE